MNQHTPRAEHLRMDSRVLVANEFFEVTHAEIVPFVSDEATWYDFDYIDDVELAAILESHYGVALEHAKLRLPFWEFLDFLAVARNRIEG